MSNLKTALIATASAGALSLTLGISPAAATPPSFTINPDVLGSGYSTSVTATDLIVSSDALVQQSGANQIETGYAQGLNFVNGNTTLFGSTTGLNGGGVGQTGYGLYLTFMGTVHNITGFGADASGSATVGPGDFNFQLTADIGQNDTFTPANPVSNTVPTVTNTTGDKVLAVGTSVSGGAGFQLPSGAPTFNVISSFIICDGNANKGTINGVEVTANGCGSFDATTYFTNPVPFYDLSINSATGGSIDNITCPDGSHSCTGPDAALDVAAKINFQGVPEPGTLAMFGSALILLGAFGWKQRRKV